MSFSCAYLIYSVLGWPSVFRIFFRQLLKNVATKANVMHQKSHQSDMFRLQFYGFFFLFIYAYFTCREI